MIGFASHVSALAGGLAPCLAALYQALRRPDYIATVSAPTSVAEALADFNDGLAGLRDAALDLNAKVLMVRWCSKAVRLDCTARFDAAVHRLTLAYASIVDLGRQLPTEQARRMEDYERDCLKQITTWLTGVVGMLADPERVVQEATNLGNGCLAIKAEVNFSTCNDLAELDTWAAPPTVYQPGEVRAVLALVDDKLEGPPVAGLRGAPLAPRNDGISFWSLLGIAFLGVAMFDTFFHHDRDDC